MIDVSVWMNKYLKALKEAFKERVWFVGLQGSYARGEATDKSDIDVVVILDELNATDITVYNSMLDTLPHRALVCGFLSGKNELLNWEPSDIFQLYYDTKPILGTLDAVLPLLDEYAVDRAIKIGVCNIYHGCVHNMLYSKSDMILKDLYKSASFVAQAIYFKENGNYIKHLAELSESASSTEKPIIDTFIALKNGKDVEFQAMSETLFNWSKNKII